MIMDREGAWSHSPPSPRLANCSEADWWWVSPALYLICNCKTLPKAKLNCTLKEMPSQNSWKLPSETQTQKNAGLGLGSLSEKA